MTDRTAVGSGTRLRRPGGQGLRALRRGAPALSHCFPGRAGGLLGPAGGSLSAGAVRSPTRVAGCTWGPEGGDRTCRSVSWVSRVPFGAPPPPPSLLAPPQHRMLGSHPQTGPLPSALRPSRVGALGPFVEVGGGGGSPPVSGARRPQSCGTSLVSCDPVSYAGTRAWPPDLPVFLEESVGMYSRS